MARTDGVMELKFNKYITSIGSQEYDFLIKGDNSYLNWGDTNGSTGWGIRANAGVMQFKNSGGTWTNFGSGGGGSYTFQNGLTETSGVVELGGILINNTSIDIDTTYLFEIVDGGNPLFTVDSGGITSNGVTTIVLDASSTTIAGNTILFVKPGNLGTATNGDVLTLVNNTTGEVEFQTPSAGASDIDFISPKYVVWQNDFNSATWNSTDAYFTQRNSGTGSGVGGPATGRLDNNHYGYITPATGTTSTGFGGFSTTDNVSALEPASGDIDFEVIIKTGAFLSIPTDAYLLKFGISDSNTALGNNSINIAYTDSINSGAWFLEMRTGGVTRATINSSVTVALNTWYKLRFTMKGTAQNLEMFINGTSAGTATPSATFAAGTGVGIVNTITKSSGVINRNYTHDYIRVKQTVNR